MVFGSTIAITGTRADGRKIAAPGLSACIVDDGNGEVLSDSSTSSDNDSITAFIKRDTWPEVDLPQMGDFVMTEDGAKYAVKRVTRLADCLSISARKV